MRRSRATLPLIFMSITPNLKHLSWQLQMEALAEKMQRQASDVDGIKPGLPPKLAYGRGLCGCHLDTDCGRLIHGA